MSKNFIDKLIICNPYKEPDVNWKYDRDTQGFKKENQRRKSGIIKSSKADINVFDDPGEFIESIYLFCGICKILLWFGV